MTGSKTRMVRDFLRASDDPDSPHWHTDPTYGRLFNFSDWLDEWNEGKPSLPPLAIDGRAYRRRVLSRRGRR